MIFLTLAALVASANAYWLMGIEDFITTVRQDPIVSPGAVSSHVHSVLGGSNFGAITNTSHLRESECTSIPIPQDKSAYWFPHLYFQWANGSFTSLDGGAVIDQPGTTTAFPDDFRMISGDPSLRTYDASSAAQRAVTFLCLDFNGKSTTYNSLPPVSCPSGIRAQINFPSCWDGKNTDSPDHKSHVAFLSGGPDSGTCNDPNFPVVLPRIFMEVYWSSNSFDSVRNQAMNSTQPFVYANGDPTGYSYHADFINGWEAGVLQRAVDECHCNIYGDATCCAQQGIFDLNQGKNCRITSALDEQTTGTLPKLPGNNPVQKEGVRATTFPDNNPPAPISPVYAYTGNSPTATGRVASVTSTNAAAPTASPAHTSSADLHVPSSPSQPAPSSPAGHSQAPPVLIPVASSASDSPGPSTYVSPGSPAQYPTTSAAHQEPAHTSSVPHQGPHSTPVSEPSTTPCEEPVTSTAAATSASSAPVDIVNPSSSTAAAEETSAAASSSIYAPPIVSTPVVSSAAAATTSTPCDTSSTAASQATDVPPAVSSAAVDAVSTSTPCATPTTATADATAVTTSQALVDVQTTASSVVAPSASPAPSSGSSANSGSSQPSGSQNSSGSSLPSQQIPGKTCKPRPNRKRSSVYAKRALHSRTFSHDNHKRFLTPIDTTV